MNARFTLADLQLFAERGLIAQASLEELPEYQAALKAEASTMTRAVEKARKSERRKNRPEQDMQRALCKWWAWKYPDSWQWTFHTPNGLAAKNRKLAAIFKGIGLKPGVPDLLCLQRRGPYTGMALELKDKNCDATTSQRAWAERLVAQGYYVGLAWSLDDAMYMIDLFHGYPAVALHEN